MKKVLALVVAAAMGLSSVAFAADAASTTLEVQQPAILPFTMQKHHKAAAETGSRAESAGGEETPQSRCKTGC